MATAAPELEPDRAFEQLYRRHARDVYQYALALLRNPADAEDITQTTFMNAYRAMKRGEEPLKPQNWLITIAHNAARSRYARQKTRVPEVPLEDHVATLAVPEADKPDVHGVLEALGELPFNQRAALVMRELEGRSYAEIAETLGVSTSAVETLIFRARRGMRLRASAIRALGAVPLPTSLASLFEGGAAGGGAIAGAGIAVKATVALVAGLFVGGAGYKAVDATLAKSPPSREATTNVAGGSAQQWVLVRPTVANPLGSRAAELRRASRHAAGSARPGRHRVARTGDEAVAAGQKASGSAVGSATGVAANAPAPATRSPAPAPASSGSDPVSGAVSTVTGAAPTPPLPDPPPLPLPAPPPVQLPPPPALPPVGVPTLPGPPPLPPVGP